LNGDGSIGPAGQAPQVSSPNFVYQGTDGNGVQLYSVTWDILGSHPFAVRVLTLTIRQPITHIASSMRYRSKAGSLSQRGVVVWTSFGNSTSENQYNATIIEPIFPINPWYADNPTDATINFETFTATLLPAWVDSRLATSGTEEELADWLLEVWIRCS